MTEPNTLGGRYELGGTLGRGGMAEVRSATDTRLGREVAVKQLRVDLAGDPTFQARFRREAQASAGLNHPNIVAVYDTGEQLDEASGIEIPYIVMELIEGQTLRDVLRDGRKILPERALEISQGVLEALGYSHKAGIVHRDIKPANVMLTPTGAIKVMDFGIARAVADTSATMTQTAAVIGTAQYLSPEQARGETVDARSDIYSAGCLLYELLVGRPPFVGDSPVSVAYQHVREAPVPPSSHDPLITPDMDAIVLKALAKSADDRYASARDMRDDIARLLSGHAVTAVLPAAAAMPPATTQQPAPMLTPSTQYFDPEPLEPEGLGLEEEEDEPEEQRRTGLWILLVGLTLVVLGLAAWGLTVLFNPAPPIAAPSPSVVMVVVPDVTNVDKTVAKDKLERQGFTVETTEIREDDDATIDKVTDQDPQGDTEAAQGATVTITVNLGPEEGSIPDNLVGKDRDSVQKKLRSAGFTNINFVKATEEPPGATKDEVTQVDPDEGSNASLDTEITVTYASGRVEVPDWTGFSKNAVTSDAEGRGLSVRFKNAYSSKPSGTVISTSPKAGTKIDKDRTVTVTLSQGPSPTPTPTDTATPDSSASASPSAEPTS